MTICQFNKYQMNAFVLKSAQDTYAKYKKQYQAPPLRTR
jgi:hypothetical protein